MSAATTTRDRVTIRFAGDSGDGMQLTGTQFTATSAIIGNDVSTFPDFPAEIRAPAGTLPGVSGFQIQFGSVNIRTPGDNPDVLVAMNPAALKVNVGDLKDGATILVNEDSFKSSNLKKAGYEESPLEDGSLAGFRLIKQPITTLTREALKDSELDTKSKDRCKNFFALGVMYWLYDRPLEPTLEWISDKFARKPELIEANHRALKAGHAFADTTEVFTTHFQVPSASHLPAGEYRQVMGNEAVALGLTTAARKANLPLFYGSYPITPASDVLHHLSKHKHMDVRTFQAEDEIAAVCAAIGASYAGALGVTGTSGPGVALKAEAIGLAVMTELPLVIVNVQRAGPSTGMPTKTEQADLLQALFGRNGESPCGVLAPATPAECFDMAILAARLALTHMCPVFILSDGYIANGAEPWKLPNPEDIAEIPVTFATEGNGEDGELLGYKHDPETLARPWAVPGTKGLEHRIGGLEKWDVTGHISYDPDNHHHMCELRADKIERMQVPDIKLNGPEEGDLLVVSWGGTYGSVITAAEQVRAEDGAKISVAHLRSLNPFPKNLEEILGRFKKVIVPELNLGQLHMLLRARFLVDAISYPKIKGRPFQVGELTAKFREVLGG
ncbi:MAG TPA: 2-oxoglutarate ferredoxin oxidoreductase subunit alpha [Planctomycetes bacterium]|nr:2-oxoglutarate ferredoxin oxidoreductase subunit alpha [Planctomycetota bacterium]